MRFILVVSASYQDFQQVVLYNGIKFPAEFHPYKDPSKEKDMYNQYKKNPLSQIGPPGSQD